MNRSHRATELCSSGFYCPGRAEDAAFLGARPILLPVGGTSEEIEEIVISSFTDITCARRKQNLPAASPCPRRPLAALLPPAYRTPLPMRRARAELTLDTDVSSFNESSLREWFAQTLALPPSSLQVESVAGSLVVVLRTTVGAEANSIATVNTINEANFSSLGLQARRAR